MGESKYKIKPDKPSGWSHDNDIKLQMYYIKQAPYYIFFYNKESAIGAGGQLSPSFESGPIPFLQGTIITDPNGNRRFEGEYRQSLDIGIRKRGGHALVTIEIVEFAGFKDLYWHQYRGSGDDIEAIMTKFDRKTFYGDLLYSDDGQNWHEVIPSNTCRFIQFKAMEKNSSRMTRDKFSYNVWLPDLTGQPTHLEIDPDIQNPRT